MNFTNDEVVMTQKLEAVLAASSYAGVPVDWPGKKSEPISGEMLVVRFGHVPQVQYAQVGGNRRRQYGSLMVQIKVPTGQGKGRLLAIADAVSSGFHKFRSGGLRCRPASYQDGLEETAFITGTVDVPYISDYSV